MSQADPGLFIDSWAMLSRVKIHVALAHALGRQANVSGATQMIYHGEADSKWHPDNDLEALPAEDRGDPQASQVFDESEHSVEPQLPSSCSFPVTMRTARN